LLTYTLIILGRCNLLIYTLVFLGGCKLAASYIYQLTVITLVVLGPKSYNLIYSIKAPNSTVSPNQGKCMSWLGFNLVELNV